MPQKVVILGGGVAGMTAAHELVRRGFAVEVYEKRSIAGGKARSLPVLEPSSHQRAPDAPSSGAPLKTWLPGEHGFRFFPRFYQHVVDTLAQIPFGAGSVADNLIETTRVQVARFDLPPFYLPSRHPCTAGDLQVTAHALSGLLSGNIGLSLDETARFATKVWQIFTSCDERRHTEHEQISWWHFVGADQESELYQRYFGHGITRSLVAAKARRASTKTIGTIFTQIVYDILRPGVGADRVLNGPTNDVWLDPWLEHLRTLGVQYHFGAEVKRICCERGLVRSATVALDGREIEVQGDYFICAVPVERMSDLLSADLLQLDPSLSNIVQLKQAVEWMNGIQFFLTRDVPIVHGHTIYLDSPWALTSVSQPQFWPDYDLADYGDGKVAGIISVDISNWNVKGLNGKAARDCSAHEIATEVWEQLKRSLNVAGQHILRDSDLHYWFLDPDIEDTDPARPGMEVNTEPLLVNYVDTWRLRPEAMTRVPNLFLASDYVRTTTDLATMEAANEAARRAVNGVLAASGSGYDPCRLWRFQEPEALAPWRAYDRVRFRQGLPWDDSLSQTVELARQVAERTQGLLQWSSEPRGVDTLGGVTDVGSVANVAAFGGAQQSLRDLAGLAQGLLGTAEPALTGAQPAANRQRPSMESE
jgi:uncharacterized protein with NAD-binding domain and iron-sulfur cluster